MFAKVLAQCVRMGACVSLEQQQQQLDDPERQLKGDQRWLNRV
jgi:hypothetical protein